MTRVIQTRERMVAATGRGGGGGARGGGGEEVSDLRDQRTRKGRRGLQPGRKAVLLEGLLSHKSTWQRLRGLLARLQSLHTQGQSSEPQIFHLENGANNSYPFYSQHCHEELIGQWIWPQDVKT